MLMLLLWCFFMVKEDAGNIVVYWSCVGEVSLLVFIFHEGAENSVILKVQVPERFTSIFLPTLPYLTLCK